MTSKVTQFRDLHQQDMPLLIGNVWNAQSAKIFANAGYKAIATSSSAVAATLGYADGEYMSFEEYLFIIERIIKAVDLPLSVDLEGGYGETPEAIVENIKHLSELGVVGINIEDSLIINGTRTISALSHFANKISKVVTLVKTSGIDMFINLRSDVYLLGLSPALDTAADREKVYSKTGVDGIFLPCITSIKEIRSLARITSLPLNVMCMPGLPDFEELKNAGVKRISSGNFLNQKIYKDLSEQLTRIGEGKSFAPVFG